MRKQFKVLARRATTTTTKTARRTTRRTAIYFTFYLLHNKFNYVARELGNQQRQTLLVASGNMVNDCV